MLQGLRVGLLLPSLDGELTRSVPRPDLTRIICWLNSLGTGNHGFGGVIRLNCLPFLREGNG